jgi:hypothetical protein
MLNRRNAFQLACIAIVIALFVAGCESHQHETDSSAWSARLFTELQSSTVPSNAIHVVHSPARPTSWSRSMSWEFDLESDGPDYRSWVTSQLGSDFDAVRAEPSHLAFARYLTGDSESVSIDLTPSGNALHVRVRAALYSD